MRKKGTAAAAVCAALMFSINGCAPANRIASADQTAESTEWKTVVTIKDEAVPLYSKPAGSSVKVPQASGTVTYNSNSVLLDASNTSHGYVMVQYSGDSSKIKVQVLKSGEKLIPMI